jgi:hypothetical protein
VLVGDREKERTVGALSRAYAAGYVDENELERRVGLALQAETGLQLASSVRGIPGAVSEVAIHGIVRPALRHRTFGLRVALARLIMKLALGAWSATTIVVAVVALVWALAAGVPVGVGVALGVVWLSVSGLVLAARRTARRLLRP